MANPIFPWSPIVGCSPASPGCINCYAPDFAKGADRLTMDGRGGKVWTGELRFQAASLSAIERLRAGTVVLVCPHGDLFHENAPDDWLDMIFAAMAYSGHNTYQILTKRTARMLLYCARRFGQAALPSNLIFGTCAERQIEADQRIADLMALKSDRLLINLYPLLGPIRLADVPGINFSRIIEVHGGQDHKRPADPAWFEAIAAECAANNLSFRIADLPAEVARRGF